MSFDMDDADRRLDADETHGHAGGWYDKDPVGFDQILAEGLAFLDTRTDEQLSAVINTLNTNNEGATR